MLLKEEICVPTFALSAVSRWQDREEPHTALLHVACSFTVLEQITKAYNHSHRLPATRESNHTSLDE